MNVVIPLVGEGKRFQLGGFEEPKPLIKIFNKPILQHSIESLNIDGNYIFVVREYENNKWNRELSSLIKSLKPNSKIILSKKLTRGAAESVLLAKENINDDTPLIVTNCDQYIDWQENELNNFYFSILEKNCDALVTTFNHINPEHIKINEKTPYSFIKINKDGDATQFSEKIAISKLMLNGIHFWKRGSMFVQSAESIIEKNINYNNEFYVSLTFNELIQKYKVKHFQMTDSSFYSLGTPEDVELFKNKKILK
jgi:NDP-sugar pyrophosphorylase family protein